MGWFVYILECADRTLYVGVTNDLEKRIAAHEGGKGARYTRGRAPLLLRHTEPASSRGEAQKREAAIRKLSRAGKLAIFSTSPSSRPSSPRGRPSPSGPSRARGRGPT